MDTKIRLPYRSTFLAILFIFLVFFGESSTHVKHRDPTYQCHAHQSEEKQFLHSGQQFYHGQIFFPTDDAVVSMVTACVLLLVKRCVAENYSTEAH